MAYNYLIDNFILAWLQRKVRLSQYIPNRYRGLEDLALHINEEMWWRWKEEHQECSLENCDEQADEENVANDQIQRHGCRNDPPTRDALVFRSVCTRSWMEIKKFAKENWNKMQKLNHFLL